jgi:hypothetical protein
MIIGVLGLIESGKSTISNILEKNHNFKQLSFADSLKEAVSAIFGWPLEMIQGNTPESRLWREEVDEWWANRLQIPELTPRWILQQWGTTIGRNSFHNDIWIASVQRKLINNKNDIVITDCRFANEISAIRDSGGKFIKVIRGPEPEWYKIAIDALDNPRKTVNNMTLLYPTVHISEWGWANQKVDYIIENNSDFKDLEIKVAELINNLR